MIALDLPFAIGKWSGEILFQYDDEVETKRHATCYLDIVDIEASYFCRGSIKDLHSAEGYEFLLELDHFAADNNFTHWEYTDQRYGSIAGEMTFAGNVFIASGVNKTGDCLFTVSLQAVEATHYCASGIVHKAGSKRLSWHGNIYLFEPHKVKALKQNRGMP